MSRLDELKAELDELNKYEAALIENLWQNSEESIDSSGARLSQEYLKARVVKLAQEYVEKYPNANPVLVGLMDGAVNFAALLCEELQKRGYKHDYTTMTVSSYRKQMESGELVLGAMPKVDLLMRDLVIVDDVCDTGKTLEKVVERFKEELPKSISTMVLVDKFQKRDYHPDYVAVTVGKDAFIIGCGLDYQHALRDKTSIRNANLKFLPDYQNDPKLKRKSEVTAEIKELNNEQRKLRAPRAFFPVANPVHPAAASVEPKEARTMAGV